MKEKVKTENERQRKKNKERSKETIEYHKNVKMTTSAKEEIGFHAK